MLNDFFETWKNVNYSINLSNEFITHSSAGQDVLTNKVKENFIEAISQ